MCSSPTQQQQERNPSSRLVDRRALQRHFPPRAVFCCCIYSAACLGSSGRKAQHCSSLGVDAFSIWWGILYTNECLRATIVKLTGLDITWFYVTSTGTITCSGDAEQYTLKFLEEEEWPGCSCRLPQLGSCWNSWPWERDYCCKSLAICRKNWSAFKILYKPTFVVVLCEVGTGALQC